MENQDSLGNQMYEALLQGATDPVVTIDENKSIIFWNKAAEKLWGYSAAETLGKNINQFVPDRIKKEHNSYVEKNLKTNVNRIVGIGREELLQRKDGTMVPIMLTMSKIEQEKKSYYMAILRDISKEKEATQNMQGLVDTIDASFARIEFDSKGNILDVNQNFLKTLGYNLPEDVIGEHHSMFVDREYRNSRDYTNFWKDLANGATQEGEFKRITKQGTDAWIQAVYTPIKTDLGDVVKVIKIATDITEQKRREGQMAKQAELIMEMSTPVMRLWDNILLLPIIGLVDSKRVQLIMETALKNILEYQAKIIVLDIQGVPAVDSAVANHIIKITRATKLMGCKCIVTGISPEISQALVNLGIDLGDIVTQPNLKEGVSDSLKSLGFQIKEIKSN